MIVLTGSTGRVGRLVAEELARRGAEMRLLVRDRSRAPRVAGADVVEGDYGDRVSLARALGEGDVVFMVSMHVGYERRVALHRSFLETAAARRVGCVVYLSFVNAGAGATFLHARSHGATEEMLARSGLPYTAVRNGMYADEIPTWFDAAGVNRVPGGDGRMSFTYRPELAAAIAVLLTEPADRRRIYDVTTPEAVTMAELARLAAMTGDPYRHEPASDAEWEARWRARGREDWRIEAGLSSYAALRAGELDVVTNDYRELTGRDPQTVAEIVARLAPEMPLAAQAPGRARAAETRSSTSGT